MECDVVHEGISWFGDKGSETCRVKMDVLGTPEGAPLFLDASQPAFVEEALALPDGASLEEPGALPMHGIHRRIVENLVREHGATLVHIESDERSGKEWVGYRYFVRKLR